MNRNTTFIFATAVATVMGGAAFADNGFVTGHHELPDRDNNVHMGDTMRGHFEHADQNGDGKVSRAEMEAHMNAAMEFQSMFEDRNGPGNR
ncbi:hypothetical protein [Roseovarius pelagicus]|uniref:EF-hand domain-containing protein n=1 Tax=Roseovarius pelagicus TaxID=2980108 RepID=A0ABY6DGD8_9RHOB|nr:hypothetical protein [Roseovarius pelagicus]UXX85237.1 hypothetical protein N7U68_20540 [Roseovarius pelagicus]